MYAKEEKGNYDKCRTVILEEGSGCIPFLRQEALLLILKSVSSGRAMQANIIHGLVLPVHNDVCLEQKACAETG